MLSEILLLLMLKQKNGMSWDLFQLLQYGPFPGRARIEHLFLRSLLSLLLSDKNNPGVFPEALLLWLTLEQCNMSHLYVFPLHLHFR